MVSLVHTCHDNEYQHFKLQKVVNQGIFLYRELTYEAVAVYSRRLGEGAGMRFQVLPREARHGLAWPSVLLPLLHV